MAETRTVNTIETPGGECTARKLNFKRSKNILTAFVVACLLFNLFVSKSFASRLNDVAYKATQNLIIQQTSIYDKAPMKLAFNDIKNDQSSTKKEQANTEVCANTVIPVYTMKELETAIGKNPKQAYTMLTTQGNPPTLQEIFPELIEEQVSPNQFKDLTQFNEKDDAILPNGMPMGLNMWSDVAILNVTKEQQLKQAEKGVKGLEKLEKYFEKTGEMWAMSMDLGKANWYKRAALQTKKQINKLKAYIAKLKQLIKEGKTNVKEDPPAIISFSMVKAYVAVVGNWLIQIDETRGITMFQIDQTARLVANGEGGLKEPYSEQQLKQLMESDTFYMGLGDGYVTSDGVGVIEADNGQPMGYIITQDMIGRLFNIDFHSLSLNERVQKIYELIQNGDISFYILRGGQVLAIRAGYSVLMCSKIHNNKYAYGYLRDLSKVKVIEVDDTIKHYNYLVMVSSIRRTKDNIKYFALLALTIQPKGFKYIYIKGKSSVVSLCDICRAGIVRVNKEIRVRYE